MGGDNRTYNNLNKGSRWDVAQLVVREAVNFEVAGSSPAIPVAVLAQFGRAGH